MLIEETHEVEWGPEAASKPVRYTGERSVQPCHRGRNQRTIATWAVLAVSRVAYAFSHVCDFPSVLLGFLFLDMLYTEQEREMSIKSTPMSLVMPDTRGKNFLVNVLDTPGPFFSFARLNCIIAGLSFSNSYCWVIT